MLNITDFKSKNSDLISSDKRIVLAYSGGLDSSVLMHLLALCVDHSRLLIWHINHQLQECADDMALFCEQQVQQNQLTFKISHLNLSHINNNVEAQARDARYSAFEKSLNLKTDILLTAHHADDQLETMLLNMCRGTGVSGLRGIGKNIEIKNIATLRPLLLYSRLEIQDFAKNNAIPWFEDPTNALTCFDRNYIRQHVAPKIKTRWASVNKSFQQVANHQKEAAICLQELALMDYELCTSDNEFSRLKTINIKLLKEKSIARQKNLLRYWLLLNSNTITMHQLDLVIQVIDFYECGYKQIQLKNAFIGLFSGELFCVINNDIKDKKEVIEWLDKHHENYRCRVNNNDKSISSHFFKRQFQSKKIPPWLRDQTVFLIDEKGSKHNVETIVL